MSHPLSTLAAAGGRRRILVIEDEPDLVRGLRDALEFEGFEVISSGLGREGVRLLRERGPDHSPRATLGSSRLQRSSRITPECRRASRE